METNEVKIGFRHVTGHSFWIENAWKYILIFLMILIVLILGGNIIVFMRQRQNRSRKTIEEFLKN